MPLYAITHTDYVGGENPHEQADDAAGCIEFFEAENAESASFASRKAEYDACDFKEQLRNGIDSFTDETAVINLDLIFAAMREKGVLIVPPGHDALLAKWVELFKRSKEIDAASDKEGAHWESLCIGWCMAQGLSVDDAVNFYFARIQSGNHF